MLCLWLFMILWNYWTQGLLPNVAKCCKVLFWAVTLCGWLGFVPLCVNWLQGCSPAFEIYAILSSGWTEHGDKLNVRQVVSMLNSSVILHSAAQAGTSILLNIYQDQLVQSSAKQRKLCFIICSYAALNLISPACWLIYKTDSSSESMFVPMLPLIWCCHCLLAYL